MNDKNYSTIGKIAQVAPNPIQSNEKSTTSNAYLMVTSLEEYTLKKINKYWLFTDA